LVGAMWTTYPQYHIRILVICDQQQAQ